MAERITKQKYAEAVEAAQALKEKKAQLTDGRESELDAVYTFEDNNDEIEPAPEKDIFVPTLFIVKLAGFETHKVDIIKAVREILNCGLKEGKDLVEAKPKPVTVKEFDSLQEAKAAAILLMTSGADVEFHTCSFIESAYALNEGEKTQFDVILLSVNDRKVDIIKAVREILP